MWKRKYKPQKKNIETFDYTEMENLWTEKQNYKPRKAKEAPLCRGKYFPRTHKKNNYYPGYTKNFQNTFKLLKKMERSDIP